MFDKLIHSSLGNRLMVLVLAVVLLIAGVFNYGRSGHGKALDDFFGLHNDLDGLINC